MRSLPEVLAELRGHLLDPALLRRAVASGRRHAQEAPPRVEVRPVHLKSGPHLQLVTSTDRAPLVKNFPQGDPGLSVVIDELLARPYGNWHLETLDETLQVRVTKKGDALVHRARHAVEADAPEGPAPHDRVKEHLLTPDDPLFRALGADGDKRRQVDAFLRQLKSVVAQPLARARREGRALTMVDLGCGNAYLTLAAHHWLSSHAEGVPVRTVGLEMRTDVQARNNALVERLGLTGVEFVVASIADGVIEGEVDVVLALHACDTATDDALARAVRWRAEVILAAPCCHHEVQRQLALASATGLEPPPGYAGVVRSPILRERLCDVLTDAIRAHLLAERGYSVDVVEFIDSKHTPRNALIRARHTGLLPDAAVRAAHAELVAGWHLHPVLAQRLEQAALLGPAALPAPGEVLDPAQLLGQGE